MVHIKRIELKGFKTFRSRVALNLDKGLTVFTGPNGSGKSNIMDAVKFALGELSPKGLRGNNFEDLISKTPQRFLSESAYVAIQFSNDDRRIPIDSDRVTISRQFQRGGEGVYRINGRRTSRKQISDALSSAGITFSGLNIIPQHTVTRLAEMTTDERRKIIEDMIGVGIYDNKKAEAMKQLELADLNIRVASAKVDEVRSRVESLEQERNDLLRSRFLDEETQMLHAIKISDRLYSLEDDSATCRQEVKQLEEIIEKLRFERGRLTKSTEDLEEEKIEFEEKTIEKDMERLFSLERKIGHITAEIVKITYEEQARKKSVNLLSNEKKLLDDNLTSYQTKVIDVEAKLKSLEKKRKKIESDLKDLNLLKEEKVSKIEGLRKEASVSLKEMDAFSKEEHNHLKKINALTSAFTACQTKLEMNKKLADELEKHIVEYNNYRRALSEKKMTFQEGIKSEKAKIEGIERKIETLFSKMEEKEGDVNNAFITAKKVKEALIKLQTEKIIHEKISPDERALQKMEKLIDEGELKGAHGRLVNLIEIPKNYRYALEIASNGWLNGLVVEDLDTAITCIEILKHFRLGRMKIIPLSNISVVQPIEFYRDDPEFIGRAVDLLKIQDKFQPAVNFVFGDTIVTADQKSAFLHSQGGVRAVGVQGDLFEPKGGIESSSYRDGFDVWDFTFPEGEFKDLESMSNNLESLAKKSRNDIENLTTEIEDLKLLKIKLQNSILMMKGEIEKIQEEDERIYSSLSESKFKKEKLTQLNLDLTSKISKYKEKMEESNAKLIIIQKRKNDVKSFVVSSNIGKAEEDLISINDKLESLSHEHLSINSEIAMKKSSLTVLKSTLQNDFKRLKEIERKITRLREEEDTQDKKDLKEKLNRYNDERKKLDEKLSKTKKEKTAYEHRLSEMQDQLRSSYEKLEELGGKMNTTVTKLKEMEIEKSFLFKELKDLGFNKPIEPIKMKMRPVDLDKTIKALEGELDRIGAVNQLADVQYEEYKNNYKQLSVRINEIETEKLSILKFMNELDEKKKVAFMQAFVKVKSALTEIFSVITNGGSATLKLENEEEPFTKGVEILLQLPGKAQFTIEGASGGEKSVATVCFILALQTIHPMPFYMFDEIDAHLDPLNAQRLADLLKDRSMGSQFMIISLKDTVISRADRVYGIYLEFGSSKLVQLPTQEALA